MARWRAIPDVGIEGVFEVPSDPGRYRLELDYTGLLPDMPSSRVIAAWTFDSSTTDETVPLPPSSIAFRPHLDDLNGAPAGVPFLVPLHGFAQPDSDAGPLHRPEVAVSYDDGATWRPAPVFGSPRARFALLFHPRHAGWVSLRASAADGRGNTVEETVLRAYRLR